MKKLPSLIAGLIIVTCASFLASRVTYANQPPADLFFSEYIEGSSNNKALEIYNPTALAVDLSNYAIEIHFNGSATPGATLSLPSAALAVGDVFVVCNPAFDPASISKCDLTVPGVSSVVAFNGNDAIVLKNGSTVLDVIGTIGQNPGTEWGTGLTSTADNTLVRKCAITHGDTSGGDAFDPATEWDGFLANTFDYLGSHTTCYESDIDGDGVEDALDNCPLVANPDQIDQDSDSVGDVCDNCPLISNTNQLDSNGNGIGDACEAITPVCGDGVVEGGEVCDLNAQSCTTLEGYAGNQTCNLACDGWEICLTTESCGDGVINGLEQCDDDGQNGVVCTPGYGGECNYCDSVCQLVGIVGPYCGDGVLNGEEACDDGNVIDGDGCDSLCRMEIVEPGSISGFKYYDWDGDGVFEPSPWEFKISGWKIFLDENGNGAYDFGERLAVTGGLFGVPLGRYTFKDLYPGTYQVCEVQKPSWQSSLPGGSNCQLVVVSSGEHKNSVNFGNFMTPPWWLFRR